MTDVRIRGTCSFDMMMTSATPSQAGAYVETTMDGITTKGRAPMAYTLPNDHKVEVRISYVDSHGNPAAVDGDVTWSTSDATMATVNIPDDTDMTTVEIVPAGALGQVQVTATADADLGAGVTNLITTFDVSVVAGQAVAGTIAPVGGPIPIA